MLFWKMVWSLTSVQHHTVNYKPINQEDLRNALSPVKNLVAIVKAIATTKQPPLDDDIYQILKDECNSVSDTLKAIHEADYIIKPVRKQYFKVNDVILVTEGSYRDELFLVNDVITDDQDYEYVVCQRVNSSSSTKYRFDCGCADIVIRDGKLHGDLGKYEIRIKS